MRQSKDYNKNKKEIEAVIESLNGNLALFQQLAVTRTTALTTWLSQRVLENYDRYVSNIDVMKTALKSETRDEILETWPDAEGFTDFNRYWTDCPTQDGIDTYNEVMNGISDENGIVKKGVKLIANEYNMRNKNGKKSLPMPKELYKQILMPTKSAYPFSAIDNDQELFYDPVMELL